MLSPAVEDLVTQLAKLPGIGRRTAQRLTFHLLSVTAEDAGELARAIEEVKARVRFCRECGNLTEEEVCEVCSDERRDRTVICVVEQPVDVVSLERTHEFRGLYHVLGGALSPLDGVEPSDLRIGGLLARIERGGVDEIVLATNPDDDRRGDGGIPRRPTARERCVSRGSRAGFRSAVTSNTPTR